MTFPKILSEVISQRSGTELLSPLVFIIPFSIEYILCATEYGLSGNSKTTISPIFISPYQLFHKKQDQTY